MYWSSNFLAVIFNKQEISQQVVTRMEDLASKFSKIFRGLYPGPSHLPHPTPSPAFDQGLQHWSHSTFQPWLCSCNVKREDEKHNDNLKMAMSMLMSMMEVMRM